MLFFAVMISVSAVMAQGGGGGGFQRRTPEERTKMVMDKFTDFKLDEKKSAEVDSIFIQFYRAQDKLRQEMMAGGGQPDFQAMREKMQPLMTDRDDKLKKALTDDQYKKWKDEIEPSLRPQRPAGGGGQ